jgi:hypothetical protein
MRTLLAAALALSLSGCADSEFVEHPITSLFGDSEPAPAPEQPVQQAPEALPATASQQPASQTNVAQTPASVQAHCKALAKLRAGDAAFQGEDPDTQSEVYDRTYRDCVAWDAAHRS